MKEMGPVEIKVFKDAYLDSLIISNPLGASLLPSQMSPGIIDIEMFMPSNPFAFAKNVDYELNFVLKNGLQPEMRIVVQMPD